MQKIYINTETRTFYDASGWLFADGFPKLAYKRSEQFVFQLCTESPDAGTEGSDPENWAKDTQYNLDGITALLSVDNDFLKRRKGTISAAIEAGTVSSISATIANASTATIRKSGSLRVFAADGTPEGFEYTSFTINGNTVTFTLAEGSTATGNYDVGCVIDVPDAIYMQAAMSNESDPASGLFVFDLVADSDKLRDAMEYSDASKLNDIAGMELLLFTVNGNDITECDSYLCNTVSVTATMAEANPDAQMPSTFEDTLLGLIAAALGSGLTSQFSVDGSSWHDEQQDADMYMRFRLTSTGNSGVWLVIPAGLCVGQGLLCPRRIAERPQGLRIPTSEDEQRLPFAFPQQRGRRIARLARAAAPQDTQLQTGKKAFGVLRGKNAILHAAGEARRVFGQRGPERHAEGQPRRALDVQEQRVLRGKNRGSDTMAPDLLLPVGPAAPKTNMAGDAVVCRKEADRSLRRLRPEGQRRLRAPEIGERRQERLLPGILPPEGRRAALGDDGAQRPGRERQLPEPRGQRILHRKSEAVPLAHTGGKSVLLPRCRQGGRQDSSPLRPRFPDNTGRTALDGCRGGKRRKVYAARASQQGFQLQGRKLFLNLRTQGLAVLPQRVAEETELRLRPAAFEQQEAPQQGQRLLLITPAAEKRHIAGDAKGPELPLWRGARKRGR